MKFTDTIKSLAAALELVEKSYDLSGEIQNDPVNFALKFQNPHDQEVVAFIAALFSYGRVKQIQNTLTKILSFLGENPYEILKNKTGLYWKKTIPLNFRHRFNNHHDLVSLLTWIGTALRKSGTLEDFFMSSQPLKPQLLEPLLEDFISRLTGSGTEQTRGLKFLLPKPSRKSGCKRLLLFLRWVAGHGPMDLGIWTKLPRNLLVIPVDTHVLRISRHLGLTKRKDSSWRTALEITQKLKLLDSEDPTRFDFALCHLGISQECPSRFDKVICLDCRMNHVCVTFKKSKKYALLLAI